MLNLAGASTPACCLMRHLDAHLDVRCKNKTKLNATCAFTELRSHEYDGSLVTASLLASRCVTMEALVEMLPFLAPSSRLDLKVVALHHALGLTGSKEGRTLMMGAAIVKDGKTLEEILLSLTHDTNESVEKDAALALINLSGDEEVAVKMRAPEIVSVIWKRIADPECRIADPLCMILSNLTINPSLCQMVYSRLNDDGVSMDDVVSIFCREGYNKRGAALHYIGPVLSNLSQLPKVRGEILSRTGCVVERLLPFTEFKSSRVRRGGIIGTLRNCCFDFGHHEWLLGEDVDILPRLLLPLAGPTPEDMEPDEVEKLPVDLQYLDEDKGVEEDPDLRKMLLETLNQLCATRIGREVMRQKNAYFILRELHKSEKDASVRLACENVVDILIKKEDEEIKVDNYKEVSVPDDVIPELENMDKEYLQSDASADTKVEEK